MKENEYLVERILDKKFINGIAYYFVKWTGYGMDESTWEPVTNLNKCKWILTQYENGLVEKSIKKNLCDLKQKLEKNENVFKKKIIKLKKSDNDEKINSKNKIDLKDNLNGKEKIKEILKKRKNKLKYKEKFKNVAEKNEKNENNSTNNNTTSYDKDSNTNFSKTIFNIKKESENSEKLLKNSSNKNDENLKEYSSVIKLESDYVYNINKIDCTIDLIRDCEGSLLYDQPNKIIDHILEGEKVQYKVEWNKRYDFSEPEATFICSEDLIRRNNELIVEYLENKFVKLKK
jgi:hypothetical protein